MFTLSKDGFVGIIDKLSTAKDVMVFLATGGKGVSGTVEVTATMEAFVSTVNMAAKIKASVFKRNVDLKLPGGFILGYRGGNTQFGVKAPDKDSFVRFKKLAEAYGITTGTVVKDRLIFVDVKKASKVTVPAGWNNG